MIISKIARDRLLYLQEMYNRNEFPIPTIKTREECLTRIHELCKLFRIVFNIAKVDNKEVLIFDFQENTNNLRKTILDHIKAIKQLNTTEPDYIKARDNLLDTIAELVNKI